MNNQNNNMYVMYVCMLLFNNNWIIVESAPYLDENVPTPSSER